MIDYILNLFHRHSWVTVMTYYGDQINANNGKRTLKKCGVCGKYKAF